jgi:hypothetical protein
MYPTPARLLWSSANANWGSLINANKESAVIDLRDVCDVWLAVAVTGAHAGTTPTLDVALDLRDNVQPTPNWFLDALEITQITAGPAQQHASGGLHIATNPLVLPEAGRIRATIGGTDSPSFAGVTISLFGR